MEGRGEIRSWDELIPDALGQIFSNLSLQEILTVIPRVCKSWSKVVKGPYCWQEIDIDEWSRRSQPKHLNRMLQMLITRSSGSLRKLSVSNLTDLTFSSIADHFSSTGSLQTLKLPRSEISDSLVEKVATRLSTITFLDVSYCGTIGARSLEAFGRNCKSLVKLRRVMHPSEVANKACQDDEAHAIASTMPKLKHLEMAYLLLTTKGVVEILTNCVELKFLDVRGCWDVKLDEKLFKEMCPDLEVLGPNVVDVYKNYSDGWSEYSDSDGYLGWEFVASELEDYDGESSGEVWDDERRLEELELMFYNGLDDDDYGLDWHHSP